MVLRGRLCAVFAHLPPCLAVGVLVSYKLRGDTATPRAPGISKHFNLPKQHQHLLEYAVARQAPFLYKQCVLSSCAQRFRVYPFDPRRKPYQLIDIL